MILYLHEKSLFIGFKKDNTYQREREGKRIKTQYHIVEIQVSCKISRPCMKLLIIIYELDSNEHYKSFQKEGTS